MDEQKAMIISMGQILGEEVLHVMREAKTSEPDGRIVGKAVTVSLSGTGENGRAREEGADTPGTYKDGAPVAAWAWLTHDRRYRHRGGQWGSV